MIRQWGLSDQRSASTRTFKPTPGDFHLFICSVGTPISALHNLMDDFSIPRENIIYQSIQCENDVHPGGSRNTLIILKT